LFVVNRIDSVTSGNNSARTIRP